jgi:protein required for attachment to host cells
MRLWIMIADAGRARVFATSGRRAALRELEAYVHVKSRVRAGDLGADRPGRVRSRAGDRAVAAIPSHTDLKEIETDRFASELAETLRRSRAREEFDFLAIVAPPRFLGRLRDRLDDQTRHRLVACVRKDLTRAAAQDLLHHLSSVFQAATSASVTGG